MEKIIVFIKQVPDTMEVRIDPETNRIIREGVPSIINPYDHYALETGLRLKEKYGGEVIVCTMGPPQAETALREALSLGCDQAYLLSDRLFAGSDTLATSYTLASFARKMLPVDIIICGREAMDGSTGQVAPELAEHLGLPMFSYVSKIEEISPPHLASPTFAEATAGTPAGGEERGRLKVSRMMEDHYEEIEGPLPAVITVVKEIAEPRLPSLKGMLKAKKAVINVWSQENLGAEPARLGGNGSPTRVMRVWTPEHHSKGIIMEGEPAEIAGMLYRELKQQSIL